MKVADKPRARGPAKKNQSLRAKGVGSASRLKETGEKGSSRPEKDSFVQILFEKAAVGIVITSDRRILRCNQKQCEMLGYDHPGDLTGREISDMIHPEDLPGLLAAAQTIRPGSEIENPLFFRLCGRDGEWVDVEGTAFPVRYRGRDAVLSFHTKVSERRQMTLRLRESERRLRAAETMARIGYYDIDLVSRRIFCSDGALRLFGLEPGKDALLTIEGCREWIHPEDREEIVRTLALCQEKGRSYDLVFRFLDRRREARYVHCRGEIELDKSGKAVRLFGTLQDVDERTRQEQDLKRTRADLARAQRIARVGSWEWDVESGAVHWSDEVFRIFRVSAKAPNYELVRSLVHPDDLEFWQFSVQAALDGTREFRIDYRVVRPDGTVAWIHNEADVERDPAGKAVRVFGTAQDITDLRIVEEALRTSEESLRTLFENVEMGIGFFGIDGRIIRLNRIAAERMGGKPEDFTGKRLQDFFPKKQVAEYLARLSRAAAGDAGIYEDRVSLPTGDVWVSSRFSPVRDSDGGVAGILIVSNDITERRQAAIALRESQVRLEGIIEGVGDGIIYVNRKGRVEDVNPALLKITGLGKKDLLGKTPAFLARKLIDKKNLPRVLKIVQGWFSGKSVPPFEMEFQGRVLEIRTFSDKEFGGIIGLVRDVTERRKGEDLLRESEDRFRTLVENMTDSIFVHDLEGRMMMVNRVACESTGYSRGELMNMRVGDLDRESLDRDDPGRIWHRLKEGEKAVIESVQRRKDGGDYLVEAHLNRIRLGGLPCIMGVARDITARREAEEKAKADLLEKEILLKEIHHRVKNNLQVIVSLLNLQKERIEDPEALKAFDESCRRILSMAMVHENLYRSRDFVRVNFRTYMEKMIHGLMESYRVSEDVSLDLRIGDVTLGIDNAIPCGLIINELVANALQHAFPAGRGGTVRVAMTRQGRSRCRCEVCDDGVGLPEEIHPENSESLGLFLVSVLTRQLDGQMRIDREQGTSFSIEFEI